MAKALVRGCTLLALAALSLHCAGDRGDARPKPSAAPAGKPAQARARIADAAVASRPARAERARAAYERLPLAFVENRGQEDRRVRFSAQGDRFAFHMTTR